MPLNFINQSHEEQGTKCAMKSDKNMDPPNDKPYPLGK